ncbi:alkanesulfonate monooxygenase SsuD/methylene tetrahydromethanopterin reductase-like flavin-dependent oxidoreductase (luciferase family) [Friedmanniella endophytica]|uniref:Alkanesulfonate monooxygenase SsuD/methylene tetrahydromethanopterin reductase-like flavin-dependent oxidoreductase (Luciferase family) n=1 Tax=Microlunatus kandeliicorticis TaxID=1759536 RepID=A0A7W3IV66_9ACTN|nr:LLM class flavin-dependent oxidoreductase [Microlunatus kandeliicorticis]MBA8795858.1 alkanesulfonate monooxygenase SsuD/methylene tetrahydromethanopterin reductase-like flavin-dependent oxidoreductase (luciferase family) [Microlunatus kandeliicorticis]
MPDYGRPLSFGVFVTPAAAQPETVVALAELADRSGLDLLTFQDHPYQPAFLDTWTLLAYAAARTERIGLAGNVLNLPLRPPAVLARSVASLDLLSGGRVELGLGAGAFWEAIEAMGVPRRRGGESVAALAEAIEVIRQTWAVDQRGGVRVDGEHYRVHGAKRGPAPAHPVGIWLGAYKPRMLALTGRVADGWLPSQGYLADGDLERGHAAIDEAATAAGRSPRDVRRLLNVNRPDDPAREAEAWIEQLAALALDGVDTFIVPADDAATVGLWAEEIAPAVRAVVEAERSRGNADNRSDTSTHTASETASDTSNHTSTEAPEEAEREQWDRLGLRPTPPPEAFLTDDLPWDETARPRRRPTAAGRYTDRGRAVGQHLIDVHDHLRSELTEVRSVLDQVRRGTMQAGAARSVLNDLTMRQNDWTLGAYCAQYCRVVTGHHSLEDASIFPHLRRAEDDLAPVLDRLTVEHHAIHDVLELLDARLVDFIAHPDDFTGLQDALDRLTDTLLSHLSYEEDQLVEPLARLGFYPQQV